MIKLSCLIFWLLAVERFVAMDVRGALAYTGATLFCLDAWHRLDQVRSTIAELDRREEILRSRRV